MTLPIAVALIAACLALEGFFSGSEMALVQANRLSLQTRAAEGDRGAQLALTLLEHEHALLATCLIGTNLCVVTWSTIATTVLMRWGIEAWGAALLIPLGLVLGEALPKTLAQARADEVAPIVAWPLSLFKSLFTPALLVVHGWNGALSWLLGREVEQELTRAELIDLLETTQEGPIQPQERRLIQGVLSLSEITACDAMTPLIRVVAVAETATVSGSAETAVRTRHSRLPVYRNRIDHVVGVVHQADLLFAADDSERITNHMRPVRFVPEHKKADDLFREMRESREHFMVVVDEFGGCIGVVTLEDLLEELVGDIEDEGATRRPLVNVDEDGSWVAAGNAGLETIKTVSGIELPEGNYETIAGLVLFRLGHIPRVGEQLVIDGLTLRVEDATDRAVRRVRLSAPAA